MIFILKVIAGILLYKIVNYIITNGIAQGWNPASRASGEW